MKANRIIEVMVPDFQWVLVELACYHSIWYVSRALYLPMSIIKGSSAHNKS